jgi:hypothetical protein
LEGCGLKPIVGRDGTGISHLEVERMTGVAVRSDGSMPGDETVLELIELAA